MKNQILLGGALFLVMATMASCKKEYVCKCSKTYTTGTGSTTNDYSAYTYKDNRVKAEERCNNNDETGSDIWGDYSINCDIQ